MRIAVVVTVGSRGDAELARCQVAGQSWIARLVQRLRHARSVTRIVIACATQADEIAALLDSFDVAVVPSVDPLGAACDLGGDHDGVALCGIEQLFVDPVSLDALASQKPTPRTGRIHAVLACEPLLSLTGGVFLEILTRRGLLAATSDDEPTQLDVMTWPTWPEPTHIRLERHGDFTWGAAAYEALLARDPSGASTQFDDLLDDPALRGVPCWDELCRFALLESMEPRATSILTIRCLPDPLFDRVLRHLGRLRHVSVDVLCHARASEHTADYPGVGHVYSFDSDRFSLEALETGVLDSIRERQYDLCVLPIREPKAWGFDNVLPLGDASEARAAVWLDIFGRCRPLPRFVHASTFTTGLGPPHERADAYLRRAVTSLGDFDAAQRHVETAPQHVA